MDSPLTPGAAIGSPTGGAPFPPLKAHLRDQELVHIRHAIKCAGGDKKTAARLLGVSLATLYRKLEGQPPER